jgi:hypothetical protein
MGLSQTISEVQQFVQSHWILVSGAATSTYGVVKGGLEALRVLDDFHERLANKNFEVKTTHYKTVIGADSTDVVKLRTIRFHRNVDRIAIDRRPRLNATTPIKVLEFYSVPGRAEFDEEGNFEITFREDERPRAHSERPVVLGFTIHGKANELYADQNPNAEWPDPGVRARDPVGSDLLVMEVHFPREFKLLEANGEPLVWVHGVAKDGAKKKLNSASRFALWARPRKVSVISGVHDFTRSGIATAYLRVTIEKPPIGLHIHLSWQWQKLAAAPDLPASAEPAIAAVAR